MVFVAKRKNFLQFLLSHTFLTGYGFNVFFDGSVVINRGIRCCLKPCISVSTNSCFRQNVERSVVCLGVRFDFRDSNLGNNETKVGRAQIPGFLFTIK